MRHFFPLKLISSLACLALLTATPSVSLAQPAPPKFYDLSKKPPKPAPVSESLVKEIISVHILQLDTGESVRLLGIEPSKKIEIRRAAIDYLMNRVKGKKIRLEYDKETRDNVGRLMAYVYLEEAKTADPDAGPLQEDLIWRGYAYASKKYPCKKYRRFRKYEKAARKEKNGLWD